MKLLISFVFSLLVAAPSAWSIPVKGSKILITGPSQYAVDAGKEIAKKGGNVVDVAVTVALTLSVTTPYYASLGGGGFALVKTKSKVEALDFREMAPGNTHKHFYINRPAEATWKGGTSVGVPGIPAGLYALHKKYGKLHWSQLFKKPIQLATRGFQVSGEWVQNTERAKGYFTEAGKRYFNKINGKAYLPGETLRQKNLARVLKVMQNRNTASFYRGVVARDIVNSVKKAGGVMSLRDLKVYKPRWLKPMTTTYAGHKLYMMPPPSSGGVVVHSALKMFEKVKLNEKTPFSVDEYHFIIESLSRAFRSRMLLGDPDFGKNPIEQLLAENFLTKMAESIDDDETSKLEQLTDEKLKESGETTHFSVLDRKGNAVSMTLTLNRNYGSGVVTSRYGIALNNEMNDFSTHPGKPNKWGLVHGERNYVEPGKRPLSSMSPTLVEKNGKIVMSLGAIGGPKIISSVIQVLHRLLVTKMNVDEAIQAPRVHHQYLPHQVTIWRDKLQPATIKGLEDRDHKIYKETKVSGVTRAYAIKLNKNGVLEAAFDSRGEGAAGGY